MITIFCLLAFVGAATLIPEETSNGARTLTEEETGTLTEEAINEAETEIPEDTINEGFVGGETLTEETIKQGLQQALAIERMFKLRERLGRGFGWDFVTRMSGKDVAQLARITFEAVSGGDEIFSETDTALLRRRISRISDVGSYWMSIATSVDSDDESLYTGRGKFFTLLLDFIWQRLPSDLRQLVALEDLSLDLLTRERIEQYIAESLGNDFVYDFLQISGEISSDYEMKLREDARESTKRLALAATTILNSPVMFSKDEEESVIFPLLHMADTNAQERSFPIPTGMVSSLSLIIEKRLEEQVTFFAENRSLYPKSEECITQER